MLFLIKIIINDAVHSTLLKKSLFSFNRILTGLKIATEKKNRLQSETGYNHSLFNLFNRVIKFSVEMGEFPIKFFINPIL